MSAPETLAVYLGDATLKRALADQHNFVSHLRSAAELAGWRFAIRRNTGVSQKLFPLRREYALFQMDGPIHPRALTIRRAYVGAFWNIETQPRREHFEIVSRKFEPDTVPADMAETFRQNWLRWTHQSVDEDIRREGFLFIPLQARLFDQRKWQLCKPSEMLEQVVSSNPDRAVVLSLHPRVTYTRAERRFLSVFCENNPRVTLSERPMADLLKRCDAVITMNSAVAFHGLFFRKPAILFAAADFHHIARTPDRQRPEDVFLGLDSFRPDYSGYLYWFLKMNTINGGKDTAPLQILDRFSQLGWPV